MTRTQFTFYESFYKAIRRIKSKSARAEAYDAICAYALWSVEPELDKLPDAAAIAFEFARPNLDASRRKAAGGKKGGAHSPGGTKDGQAPEAAGNEKEEAKSPVSRGYGAYQNVFLTDGELARLKEEFPDWLARIERLSVYMAQSGKRYADHCATIRSWAQRDAAKGKKNSPCADSVRKDIEQMKRMHQHMTADKSSG